MEAGIANHLQCKALVNRGITKAVTLPVSINCVNGGGNYIATASINIINGSSFYNYPSPLMF